MLRTAPNTDIVATLHRLGAIMHGEMYGLSLAPTPPEIADYRRIRHTPLALALSIALFGTAMLVVGVVGAVHRRQHQFAVLQAVGATRRQITSIIRVHAAFNYLAVILFGLPLGIIAGNAAWNAFEHRFGTRVGAHPPLFTLAWTVPLAGIVSIIAIQPIARRLARTTPAAALQRP
jgi:ABC-type antimicrobial peptide transport system permease subunit